MTLIKQFSYTPVLGWSASRFDLFRTCKRQYFYNYYGKHDKDHPKGKIDALKQMTTVPLETGNIVHDVIEVLLQRLLKSEDEIDMVRFENFAQRTTETYCRKKVFAEVYYRQVSRIDMEGITHNVRNCLHHFISSERFDWVFKKAVREKKHWIIEPGGYGETRIDGMKAYCKVDFLFPLEDKLFIVDWKTGKPHEEKHRKQLLGYTAWASFHLSKPPSEIIPIIAYLQPHYHERELIFNESDIREFSEQVAKETSEMQAYCLNISENLPKPKIEFPMTTNRTFCGFCNFRELCGLEGGHATG